MASQILTTTFGDLRLVLPHGMQPPKDPSGGGGGGGGGGGPITLPSYELDTEDWADQEEQQGGGGGAGPGGQKPPPKKKPPGEKGEKGEKGEGEPEEGEPGEGETGDEEVDKIIDKYSKSHSSDMDEQTKDLLDPDREQRPGVKPKEPGDFPGTPSGEGEGEGEDEGEGEGGEPGEPGEPGKGKGKPGGKGDAGKKKGDTREKMPYPSSLPKPTRNQVDVFWDKFEKQRREYLRDPRTAPKELERGYNPLDAIHPPGIGLGSELMNIGFKPLKTGLWKEAVKDWFKSLPEPLFKQKWTHIEPRLQSVMKQMKGLTGRSVRLPARHVKVPNPKVSRVLVFVDVSGSVFNKGVQEDFASILNSIPKQTAEIEIFTFDDGGQEGPFKPKNYNPKRGGGGTAPWEFISNILATPKYSPREIDGYLMLTDGAFAGPPAGLIKNPKDWCFVMTSSYTAEAIPKDAKIIETFVDDPEWQKHMKEANAKDVMKRTIIKK
jgi:hypothetical protein